MNKLIKYSGGIALCLLGLAGNLVSQELKTGHPDEYVVQKGDTLWDISARFLEDPWLWPEIWHINEQVANPHLIYPGDLLRLVYIDGQPRLVLDRGVVKLSPQIRESKFEDAISSIPLDTVREFLTRNRVVTAEELEAAPYMVSGPEGRILVGAGDELYVRGAIEKGINIYGVFREGEEYKDPETGDVLGLRAESKGSARYRNTSGDVSRMVVTESFAEISIGDRFFPLQQDELDPQLFPSVPAQIVSGQIMAVEGGVSQIGVMDVVAINRGADANLQVGHLLAIMEAGEKVRDRVAGETITLPDEQAGTLMVFRVHDRMSFGLVLEAEKALSVGFKVSNLFSQEAYERNRIQEAEKNKGKGILNKDFLNNVKELFEPGSRPD